METYIALLRGINVSGQKPVNMKQLKAAVEELGFSNVSTYVQSGNIVFNYKKARTKLVSELISGKIKEHFGFDVPVHTLTIAELQKAVKDFPLDKNVDTKAVYVTFLADEPKQELIQKTAALEFENEEFVINKTEVFLYCPKGYGRTKLNNNFFESKLKVIATTRNWKTVNELLKMAGEIS